MFEWIIKIYHPGLSEIAFECFYHHHHFSDGSTGFPGMKKLATNGLFRFIFCKKLCYISNHSLFSYKLRIRKRRSDWRKKEKAARPRRARKGCALQNWWIFRKVSNGFFREKNIADNKKENLLNKFVIR